MTNASDRDLGSDVARVRRVLARELETINEYEAFAVAAEDPKLRAFFLHLAKEEKEHVAEAMKLIQLLDADQAAHFSAPLELAHFAAASSPSPDLSPRPVARSVSSPSTEPLGPVDLLPPHRQLYGVQAAPHQFAGILTVGSLRNRTPPGAK